MFTWLTTNSAALAIIGASIAFAWSLIQWIATRNREQRIHEFEAYHRLIKELVSPDPTTGSTWIDRQAAVVFELRHFPRYYEFSERALGNLRSKWSADPNFTWPYLLEEIDRTLKYIREK